MEILKKFCCVVTLAGAVLTSQAQSTTTFYEAGAGERSVYFNGVPVPDGNYAAIGFFNTGFDFVANGGNLTALNAAWHQLDATSFRAIFGPPNDGRFSSSIMTSDTTFDGKKISMWLFKTTDNAAPVSGFGNVAGYGIFSSTAGNWVFPTQGAVPPGNATSVYSSEINQAFIGSFDPDPVNGHLFLVVPEPATYSLLILGAATAAAVRLRKRLR